MMQAVFNFHNVGQGLFYSGHIYCDNTQFNFVYDCGATNKTASDRSATLDTAIHRLSSDLEDDEIDLLVISHLHNDHTNGIPELLSYRKVKVKNIFIPYFTFEERLNMLLKNGSQLTEEQTKLVLNPYSYLASRDSVKKIFVIQHQQNNDGINDKDIDFNDISNGDNKQDDNDIYSGLDNVQRSKVFIFNDAQAVKAGCWRFAFYADESKTAKLAPDFYTEAKDKIDNLKTETDSKKIKNILKELRDMYKPTGKLNETSLIMAHKCTRNIEMRYIHPHHNRHHHHDDYHHHWRHCYPLCHYGSFVHILTGDFDFGNGKLDAVKNHFGKFLDSECQVLQVPHHGSKENWNSGLIEHKHTLCVIPFGVQNQYGHPSIKVKNDILNTHHTCLHEVTEHQSLMLSFIG